LNSTIIHPAKAVNFTLRLLIFSLQLKDHKQKRSISIRFVNGYHDIITKKYIAYN